MERELFNAAVEGSVETLLNLLHQDQLILRRYISGCFKETPLHIAAMFGHLQFTKLVLAHMPEMAKVLDSRKSTPLHIATANGHILIVKELLSVNAEMCFAIDWEGRNPVHIAVIKGHVEILKELIQFRPQAARTFLGASTMLHLSIKHFQVEALKYILEVIPNDAEFINSKDEEGFTILHFAVAEKQLEVVKILLQNHKVEVNAMNRYGLTALDICLAHGIKNIQDIEVVECLQQAGAFGAKLLTSPKHRPKDSKEIICNNLSRSVAYTNSNEIRFIIATNGDTEETKSLKTKSEKKKWLEDNRNSLMVVASLIATMAFQAALSPPNVLEEATFSVSRRNFALFNTLGFSASISVILLMISGLPINLSFFTWLLLVIMWIGIASTAISYFIVVSVATKLIPYDTEDPPSYPETMVIWVTEFLLVILFLGNALRLFLSIIRCFQRWKKRIRGRTNSSEQDQNCLECFVCPLFN